MRNIYFFLWSSIASLILVASPLTKTSAESLANGNVSLIPRAPDLNVKAYILIDANSGNVIAAKNPDLRLPPASLTKVMTLYLIADALKTNKITFTKEVPISERAWRMEGSRMFVQVGTSVPVRQLIDGIAVASGNDATMAMAEYLSGTEEAFVDLMNQTAEKLGLKDTHFVDSSGLPAATHYTSARDLSTLARHFILDFPEYYSWFKTKWIMYNNIKQPNRNRLLWRDPSVDGMKTGHTSNAGYCLVTSAERNGARLIVVLLHAPSDGVRANYAEALFNYGFRFFESRKIYDANIPLVKPRVWYGQKSTVPLGLMTPFYVAVPTGEKQNVKINMMVGSLKAPIKKGAVYGSVSAILSGKVIGTKPLVALQDDPQGGFWTRLIDRIILFFKK